MDAIINWFLNPDFSLILDNFSNDQMVGYLTNPWGIAVICAVLALTFFLKQKFVFVLITSVIACALIAKYIFGTEGDAVSIFSLFLGAAILVSGYVIYQLLIAEN